jgi:anti-anti-sigma factor
MSAGGLVRVLPSGEAVVRLTGELDIVNEDDVRRAVVEALGCSRQVTVDLQDVTFMDSSTVGVLVDAARSAEDSGAAFSLAAPSRLVARVLRLSSVAEGFSIRTA